MSNDPVLTKKLIDDEDVDEEKQILRVSSKRATQRGGGCLSSCCCKCTLITVLVFFALGLIMMGAAYYAMKDVVQQLTVTTPHAKFPVVEMTDAELGVVKARVELFADELKANTQDMQDLVITQDEINGFIGHSDYLRGNLFVTVLDNKVQEEYSLPTYMLPGGKGRYFVGSDYLSLDEKNQEIEMEMVTTAKHADWFDGPLFFAQLSYLVNQHNADQGKPLLELYLKKGSIFGRDAPEDYIAKHENILEDFYEDDDCDDARAILDGVEAVSIESGKIIIHPRNHK